MYQKRTLRDMGKLQRRAAENLNLMELAVRRQRKLVEDLALVNESDIWPGPDDGVPVRGDSADHDPHVIFGDEED